MSNNMPDIPDRDDKVYPRIIDERYDWITVETEPGGGWLIPRSMLEPLLNALALGKREEREKAGRDA